MKKISAIGVKFCLTDIAPLVKLTRLKVLVDLSDYGVQYLRGFYQSLEADGVYATDFKRIHAAGLQFIVDDLDESMTLNKLKSYGFMLGQGALIGLARQVKTEIPQEETV